jgi:RNA polymerase sigma factor (sigma-70 family)
LLRRYAREGCGQAFAELVRRHVDFVFAVGLRHVRDRHLAEDVAQAVFLILSQKARAGRLDPDVVLAGWLFQTTRYVVANAVKQEARRRRREETKMRNDPPRPYAGPGTNEPESPLGEAVDGALARLGAGERDALLLRFFRDLSLDEVARAMGVSVDAARKRIERGLNKMRRHLSASGVTALTVAGVSTLLAQHATAAGVAAPAGLAGTITASAGASATAGAGASLAQSAMAALAWAKVKAVACVAAILVVGSAAGIAVHDRSARRRAALPPSLVAQPVMQVQAPTNAPKPQPAAQAIQLEGTVKSPDETPAAGAEVFVVMPEDPAYASAMRQYRARVQAGERIPPQERPARQETSVDVYKAQWPPGTQSTDANGGFAYAGVGEPYLIVVRHPSGYAELPTAEFKKSNGQVWLKPWGRIEGTLYRGAQPQPGEKVVLFRYARAGAWDVEQVRQQRETTTDADGHFVFENVCPDRDLWLAWDRPPSAMWREQYTPIELEPGKTLKVDVGGRGRPVIGRAGTVPVNAPDERVSWVKNKSQDVSGSYNSAVFSERVEAQFKKPPGFERLTRDEQKVYEKAFFDSPAGRELRHHMWGRSTPVNPDGSFRIDDLVPGRYHAYLRIHVSENGFGEDVVECDADFTVPELPPGVTRLDEALDLGTIPVKLKPRALVGTVAPDFEAKTIDGKTLKLSDYRGKYVMVRWWWSWSELDVDVPPLKKAWETMRKEGDWVLITVGFEKEMETTRKRVADHQIPGIHCNFPDYKHFPAAYLGSPSQIVIIGPDGRVLARNIQGIQADEAVGQVLLEKK